MDSLTIDGLELPVQRPESVAALCELVKAQRAKREAIYPVGGRTMLDFGLPPTKPGIAVDLTALNQVIDYPARDMTITVQAGITFAKMQEILAQEGQWLPLDVPDPERMTIGGLIAANVSGPRRYGYGTLRDYVIGISFVTDDGVEVKGGGRVVKNVAGYDLMKLHIGALGTMGVISQVTLKVRPKPEMKRALRFPVQIKQLKQLLDLLNKTPSRPLAANLTLNGDCWATVAFEEKRNTVEWQIATLKDELTKSGFINDIEKAIESDPSTWVHTKDCFDDAADFLWLSIALYQSNTKSKSFLAKVTMKPEQVSDYVLKFPGALLQAEALNGIVWIHADEAISLPDIGATVVHRAPTSWKTPERVFGKPTPAFELMRHIKRTLDPDNVFNPGRMF